MTVPQVEKLLDLFEAFARRKTPLTLTAMSGELAMPKSSVFNLIGTLVARGFLYETRPRGGYYPTRRMLDLARTVMEGDPYLQRIHGELERLAQDTGETALLAVRDRDEVIYIDVVESPAMIRYSVKVGDRRPLYTTSSGKAILTTYPQQERDRILQALPYHPHQDATLRSAEDLARNLETSLAQGWCEDRAETMQDVMGLAVPIFNGERRFGLAVAGPLYRMASRREELARQVCAAGRRIMRFVGQG